MSKRAKKPTSQQRQRLADPTIYAAGDTAKADADVRFGQQIGGVLAAIKALVAERKMNDLSSEEMVRFMTLRAELDSLAIQHKQFTEATAASRLRPDGGSDLLDV